MLGDIYKKAYSLIHNKIYAYRSVRLQPSEWVEKNIFLTSAESRYSGLFSYDRSPYTKEVIDCLSPTSPVEQVGVMKCSQSGFSSGVVVNGILYTISETPANIMFLSGTKELIQDTVRDKLDPVIRNSGLSDLIRSSDTRKRNQRTGDTDFKKEFAGGSLTAGSYTPSKLRMHSVKFVFADEFDDAPRDDKKEGSILSLLKGRTKSFGTTKKEFYISTPTIKGASNIEDVFLSGDQRKWNWLCPHCNEYIPIEWRVDLGDNKYAGIKWNLDEKGELITESVHYECQKCGGAIYESDKWNHNLNGKWIPTAIPKKPQYRSYVLNSLCIPPGYDSWVDLVYQWLEACPPNDFVDEGKLKAFVNTQLGQTWEEKGKVLKASMLEKNQTDYEIGIIPDNTSKEQGNGNIVLVTLCCDLGGVMEIDNEDVRLDWEVVAHTASGATYSIEHGSIGTFKRSRKKSQKEKENESERDKWTYSFGHPTSVWPELVNLIEKVHPSQSGCIYQIDMTLIDTGNFTKLSYDFIRQYDKPFVVGVKGYGEGEYRKLSKDTPIIKRSLELLGKLYILQVNQLKDMLSSNMHLKKGMDGFQPKGFMNYPTPANGMYTYKNYYEHFEAEHRIEETKGKGENRQVIGYAWKKKNTSVENHFFDVSVYTLAAPFVFIDILRRTDSRNSKLTWEDWIELMSE